MIQSSFRSKYYIYSKSSEIILKKFKYKFLMNLFKLKLEKAFKSSSFELKALIRF